jgi:hypothetical protein
MTSKFSSSKYSALSCESERNFGLLVASGITCFILYEAVFQSSPLYRFAIGLTVAAGICVVSFLKPCLFNLPLKLWMQLGYFMGIIISPIVLGAIFFGMITPVALVTRFLGRDVLILKKYNTPTYWIERNPDRQPSNSFTTQF